MSGVKSGVLCHNSSVLLRMHGALESESHKQLDRCLTATVLSNAITCPCGRVDVFAGQPSGQA